MQAVGSTQLPSLTLEIPTPHRIIAIFIDKAVPNVDIIIPALSVRCENELPAISPK